MIRIYQYGQVADENIFARAVPTMNVEAIVGAAEEPAPTAEPLHPVSDTTSKFANLQFGRNYDPNNR